MIGAGIDDGDLVIIRQTGQAEYGQIVAVLDEMGGSTLKRLVFDKRKNRPVLHPENPEMEDIAEIAAALGLPETATKKDILAAAKAMRDREAQAAQEAANA